jgi:hypothetical protein
MSRYMVITYYCVTNTIDSKFCKQTTYTSKFELSQDFSIVTDLKLRKTLLSRMFRIYLCSINILRKLFRANCRAIICGEGLLINLPAGYGMDISIFANDLAKT